MTDEPDNLVLQHLRAIRDKVDETNVVISELRLRITAVETQNVAILSHLDRMSGDIVQIKKQIGLIPAR
jgi:hypothetical protein